MGISFSENIFIKQQHTWVPIRLKTVSSGPKVTNYPPLTDFMPIFPFYIPENP